MDRAGIGYVRRDNCFLQIANVARTQRLMDKQLRVNFRKMLDKLVPRFKGVADLHRRAAVSQSANERYLDSLAAVDETTKFGSLLEKLCQPVRWKGKRVRALNPFSADDARLLETVNRGEFSVNGFRNRDLRVLLYSATPADPAQQRRQSATVTRKLRLLRAHGLIRKVPKTHHYMLSKKGQTAITALLTARAADTAKLAVAA